MFSPIRLRILFAALTASAGVALALSVFPGAAGLGAALALALLVGWLFSWGRKAPLVEPELISNLSHEMRTPLNGILGLTQVLLDGRSSPEQRELLDMIKASGDSLLRVLNDLLDYSKIQAGKIRLEPSEFRLRRWVRQSVALHAPQVHRKGLQISYWVAPDAPDLVRADHQRLRQVLWNLIANSIKFTEEGEILVEVRASAGASSGRSRLRFSVADTGVGIPQKNRTSIFAAFAQGDNAKPEQGGLGLGLAISSEIVGRMGGEISMESEPSRGSRFEFEIELESIPEEACEATRSFPGARALVFDQSPWQREVVAKELRALGIEVEIAASTEDSLRALESTREFSFLLLDSQRLEGALSLARKVRAIAEIPVVLLLNTHQRVPREVLRSHNIAGTLTKPVAPTHLLRAIEIVSRGERVEKPEDVQTQGMDRPPLAGVRVLVAEDHPVNRTVVMRMLASLGASATAAANGREALERFALERYDILLLDLEMPEVDGIGVAREIRARERGGKAGKTRLPIVALTAHAREEQRELCFREGMDAFVTKPFEERDLTSAMRAALKLSPAPALAVHDRDSAMARASGDRALLDELTRIFLEENPETLRKIGEALEAGDGRAVERLAHRLKGALLTLAAPAAAEAALDLETTASGESFERLRREVARLEEELRNLALEGKV